MDVFGALSDKTRRKILELLAEKGEMSVAAIAEKFSLSPPSLSQHLRVLRIEGLVRVKKRGQQRIYSVRSEGIGKLADWAKGLQEQLGDRTRALENYLKQLQKKRHQKSPLSEKPGDTSAGHDL